MMLSYQGSYSTASPIGIGDRGQGDRLVYWQRGARLRSGRAGRHGEGSGLPGQQGFKDEALG